VLISFPNQRVVFFPAVTAVYNIIFVLVVSFAQYHSASSLSLSCGEHG